MLSTLCSLDDHDRCGGSFRTNEAGTQTYRGCSCSCHEPPAEPTFEEARPVGSLILTRQDLVDYLDAPDASGTPLGDTDPCADAEWRISRWVRSDNGDTWTGEPQVATGAAIKYTLSVDADMDAPAVILRSTVGEIIMVPVSKVTAIGTILPDFNEPDVPEPIRGAVVPITAFDGPI